MMLRKMTTPPDDVVEAMNKYKSPETVVLTREDLKNFLSVRKILIRQYL
jgi:acyl-CoA thioester hydrolase